MVYGKMSVKEALFGLGSECWARSWNGLHARGVGLSAVHKRCFINNTALDEIYFFYIFLLPESKLRRSSNRSPRYFQVFSTFHMA